MEQKALASPLHERSPNSRVFLKIAVCCLKELDELFTIDTFLSYSIM